MYFIVIAPLFYSLEMKSAGGRADSGCSLAYAIIRYHFAGDVAWRHFPLFILNKATSLAAVIFVASSCPSA